MKVLHGHVKNSNEFNSSLSGTALKSTSVFFNTSSEVLNTMLVTTQLNYNL